MSRYALLVLPSVNRVYADASARLMRSELHVLNQAVLGGRIGDIAEATLGGVRYLTFSADDLAEDDIAFLANLSSIYTLFELRDELLRPIEFHSLDKFDDDLLTIQKYSGKTNEQFTKLLVNVTALSTAYPADFLRRPLAVFDPLCGRGTTLNQALMYGFDASGMDIDKKDFEAYSGFIRTWLKQKKLKHQAEIVPVRREHKLVARRLNITVGASKELYKAGETIGLAYVSADTRKAGEFFRPRSFDLIVTDAPYGVQHGSRAADALSRNPIDLLAAAVPVWRELLKPGGAMGIAWNTHVAKRSALAEILADAGLQVMESEAYQGFEHRVDQAILRDIIIARRP